MELIGRGGWRASFCGHKRGLRVLRSSDGSALRSRLNGTNPRKGTAYSECPTNHSERAGHFLEPRILGA